jgi:hypothetical protein
MYRGILIPSKNRFLTATFKSNQMKQLLIGLFSLPLFASAQNFHFSGRLGLAGYSGDLKSQTNLMGSLGARYDLTERIALRSYLTLSKLRGDDKKGNEGNKVRNLNFQSGLFEWEAGAQYSFLNPNNSWWIPYAFAGVGVFHFNPKTKDENGQTVKLQPLSTEGQGVIEGVKKYGLTQLCIPMGIGIERSLNEDMRLGLEIGYRYTFGDHIDDVSGAYVDQALLLDLKGQQSVDLAYRGDEVGAGTYPSGGTLRGNAKSKDGYYYIAVTYTVRYFFDKYKQVAGLPSYKRDKKAGCPATRY